jgi:hypothetical protein
VPDDFESEDDDEVVDEEVEGVEGFDAEELLDEEPRLSLR